MFKSRLVSKKGEKGFTLIELLVVAAIIGILLAIAIPNLIKARMSANEANARKAMQTLRDAEGEYFEQDLNNAGGRDYTDTIGTLQDGGTLRCPSADSGANTGGCDEPDALIDSSFEDADAGADSADGSACAEPKAGYCISAETAEFGNANANGGFDDFAWRASMTSQNKTGRKDYAVYGDGVIRCEVSTSATGSPGTFEAGRDDPGCD
jgi:type IV pilus assembly protein PilA